MPSKARSITSSQKAFALQLEALYEARNINKGLFTLGPCSIIL
jgi:hypothetical protein